MVKSRRRAASSIDIDGSPWTSNPLCPRPALRLAARQRDVDARLARADHLVNGKALADGLDAAEGASSGRSSPCGMPKISRSRSFDGWPSSRSRTQPPTISARPPASRTAAAILRAVSSDIIQS